MRISDWSSDVCSSDLPFYTDKATGLGLGLSISYNIVEAHGGTLTASTPGDGKGMLFSLSLPIVRQDDGTPEQDRKSVVEGKSVSVRVDLGGRRIIKQKKTLLDTMLDITSR